MRKKAITVAMIFVMFGATSCECLGQSESAASLAHQLATVDAKGYIPKDSVKVVRYRALLQLLSEKSGDDFTRGLTGLANSLYAAKNALEKEGISETTLNMMEGMNSLIDPGKRQYLFEYLAVYIVARSKMSMSHLEAIRSLEKLGPNGVRILHTRLAR